MNKKTRSRLWFAVSLRPKRRGLRLALWLFTGSCAVLLCFQIALFAFNGAVSVAVAVTGEVSYIIAPELYPLQTAPPYTVALDAGHGGMDSGAEALVEEVDVCERTVDDLFALLAADPNYRPVRTRQNGEDRSTSDRALTAIENRASLLLSIHANCDSTRQSHGFECFPTPPGRVYSAQALRFAQCLTSGMSAAGHRLHGEKGIRFVYYRGHSKKVVPGTDTRVRSLRSFGIVEKPACPAVLIEQCFLTNYNDVEQWASEAGCARAARVYYEAICTYFGTAALPAAS